MSFRGSESESQFLLRVRFSGNDIIGSSTFDFQIGIKRGFIYNVNGIMFLLTFFMARVSMVPYLYYRFAIYKEIEFLDVPWNIPLHCHVFSLMFFMLQCYWFALILRSFMKALSKINTSNKPIPVDSVNGTENDKIKSQ